MNTKKVMLIRPSNTIQGDSLKRLITPLGLLYIGAVLKNKGYEVRVLDSICEGYETERQLGNSMNFGMSDSEIASEISSFSPDIVGITSMFSAQQKDALHCCDVAKSVYEGIPVVIGGVHPTIAPRESISKSSVDFVILGEGEERFLNLVQCMASEKNPKFDGIAYKTRTDIRINPSVSRIEDLDSLPFPARELIDMEKYIQIGVPLGPFTRKERVEQVMTSRGCPSRCNFCTNYFGRKFRQRSIENVLSEIKMLIDEYGIQEIQFSDDNLTANKSWSKEFFAKLKEYNISFCTPNGVMVQTLDAEVITLMADAGAYQTTFAIESGSERVLKEIIHKKVPSKEQVKSLTELCHQNGMQVHGTFIVGFPGETMKEIEKTLRYPFEACFDSASFFIANPLPGSELYDECKAKGYLNESEYKGEFKLSEILIPRSSPDFTISKTELEETVEKATKEFNEFSKKRDPEAWKKKFSRFLKQHPERKETIKGRVT